jgi:hypothetical protein
VTFTVTASSAGQPASGRVRIEFGNGQTADLGQIAGTGSATHTFTEGRYDVTAVFTRADGNETRSAIPVDVQPETRPLSAGDQIDPALITWVSMTENISNWPVTSRITDWSFDGNATVCIYHTKLGLWPLVSIDENPPNLEAQIGVVAKIGGRWYGGPYDWMRPGSACKYEPPYNWGPDQIRVWPLDASWPGPRSGDEVGLYMSTPSSNRPPVRSVNERTNIILVRWP